MPKSKKKIKTRAKTKKKTHEKVASKTKTQKAKKTGKKQKVKQNISSVVKLETAEAIDARTEEQQKNLRCLQLINIVRKSKDENKANRAFQELVGMLIPKIQKVVNRFNIPGYDSSDILQEALYALRYKAVKDYDKERGNGDGPAPFDKFALLCIRRHLATEFKSSYQNKKRVLNQSVSIDKETNNNNSQSSDSEIYLSNIISDNKMPDVLSQVSENEYFENLQTLLYNNLSKFEREVYLLYAQKFSYEEIAQKINDKRNKILVNIKGVDNALSRIKHKAHMILQNYELKNSLQR